MRLLKVCFESREVFSRWHANLSVIMKFYFPRLRAQPCRKRVDCRALNDSTMWFFLIQRLSPIHVRQNNFLFISHDICWHWNFQFNFKTTHSNDIFFLYLPFENKNPNHIGWVKQSSAQCRQCLKMLLKHPTCEFNFIYYWIIFLI